MIPGWMFPAIVAVLEGCAALVYTYQQSYRLAIVWLGVAIANAAMAGIK